MLKSGYLYMPYISLEKLIEESKEEYYICLRKSQGTFESKKWDMLDWTRYFLDICLLQVTEAIGILSNENMEMLLSKKQFEVYNIALKLKEFTIKDITGETSIPRPTIKQAVNKLLAMKKITQLGAGRGTRYKINI
jgi:Fic family protein